ncbi:MAG: bacillithiol system redox-active protein YtxJ [Calditrichia bacterium]
MNNIISIDDFNNITKQSESKPVFLFKHSTRCGVSAAAWQEFDAFMSEIAAGDNSVDFSRVLVVEDRPTSLKIAETTKVPHQSPQVMLIRKGNVVWHTSHWAITKSKLHEALSTFAESV